MLRGRHCRDGMVAGFQRHVQSVPITTKVVSWNHSKVYSMQHYVIQFVIDLRKVCGFLLGTPVSSTSKTDSHDKAKILLKMASNTIILALTLSYDAL